MENVKRMVYMKKIGPKGPFFKFSGKCARPDSRSKISMTAELLYTRILKVKRGSLHTRSSRLMHLSIHTSYIKMACWARNVSGAFGRNRPLAASFHSV